jgi:cytochrome P450
VSSGKDWFAQRKIITPAFHFNILDDFISVFNKQTDQMIEVLKKHADEGVVFNIYDNVTLCALDIICGKL